MTGVVQLGPLAMPTDRLLAMIAIWLFVMLAPWLLRRESPRAASVVWIALAAGFVVARLAYVASHAGAFSEDPITILYVWQGGFSAIAGIVAAAAILAAGLGTMSARAKGLAALAVAAAVWFVAARLVAAPAPMLPTGLMARRMDGSIVSFDAMRGTPYVINLWATWCPPCRRELPMLARVANARQGPPIFFVDQRESPAAVARFLSKEKLRLGTVLIDATGMVAERTASPALPTTLFVDADGRVRVVHFGEISRAALADGMDAIRRKD